MMYDSKINQVSLLNWRWIFGLGINLVALAMQSGVASAQANELIAQPTPKTGDRVVNSNTAPAELEPKILSEINRVRTDPQGYAQWLEEQQQYFDGIWLRLPGEKPIRTNRGRKALQEAIAILKEQPPLPPLEISDQTAAKATSELENFATANNIQFFSYGRTTATGIVMGLVVDDLFPDRRRRNSLLSPEAENTGVVCQPDPRYAKVCAIAYSDSPATANVAEANEPPATDSEPVAESADAIPEVEAVPEVTINPDLPEPSSDENEPAPEPEVTVPEATESSSDEDEPAPEPEVITPPTDNTELETELPQPPQPQAPPAPANDSEAEELARAEAEIEAATPKSDGATETTDEVEVPEVMVEETEEIESEEASADDDTEQVALDSDSSRLLEQVERGALEEGDRVIDEDGSLYDFYPIEGKKGETYTIYLESDEFDAFVALVDSNGNTIEENDDISQENSNSRIRVTLPEDGNYNVIVNTYDEEGSGQYVLTVTR